MLRRHAGCVALTTALLLLSPCPSRAFGRPTRGAGHPAPVKAAGVVIQLKTSSVTIESNRADIILEATTAEAEGHPRQQESLRTGAGGDVSGPGAARDPNASGTLLAPDEEVWQVACTVPCDKRLPRDAVFRITGVGVTTSSMFTLPREKPSVVLQVKAGSARWYWSGIVSSAFGASFLLGGAVPPLLQGGPFSTTEKVLGATGAALMIAGIPLWVLNRTTVAVF